MFVAYDPGSSGDGSIENTPFGIFLCLFSAVMYGVYTTEIRKFIPEDDPKFSMTLFFGFLGLCNSILLLPVILALHFTGTEDLSDTTAVIILWIVRCSAVSFSDPLQPARRLFDLPSLPPFTPPCALLLFSSNFRSC